MIFIGLAAARGRSPCGVLASKAAGAAKKAVEFFVENELSGEEDRIWKLMGDIKAKALQFNYHVRSQACSKFGMEAQVRREPAIFEHIVGDLLFELAYLPGAFQKCRVHFTDADKNDVGKLPFE